MITKILGIILIMASTALLGYGFSECMSSRERELKNLADAIGAMINELDYTMEPVKQLFKKVMPSVRGASAEVFEIIIECIDRGDSSADAWSVAIKSKAAAMCLSKPDCDALVNSCDAFSAHELEQQKSLLKGLQSRILVLADNAAEFKRKNGRLAQMLGIYGGVLICAVLF